MIEIQASLWCLMCVREVAAGCRCVADGAGVCPVTGGAEEVPGVVADWD
jgi:hypothetical protein